MKQVIVKASAPQNHKNTQKIAKGQRSMKTVTWTSQGSIWALSL